MKDFSATEDLYNYMIDNFVYGFISQSGEKWIRQKGINDDEYKKELFSNYYLQAPIELEESKVGICFDQVLFARYILLKMGYKVYFFYSKERNHVFLIFKDGNKYALFETTIKWQNGIHYYSTLNDCLRRYCCDQMQYNNVSCMHLYRFENLNAGMTTDEIFSITNSGLYFVAKRKGNKIALKSVI